VEVRHIDPRPPRLPKGTQARPLAVQRYLVVHILVDVCEAMGANVVNTVAEGIAPRVSAITGGRIGLRILSNLAVHRVAQVRPVLPRNCDVHELIMPCARGRLGATGRHSRPSASR